MAKLEILKYPDKRLRTVAAPVTSFDENLQKLIDDMFETMYANSGIGLSAPQVDRNLRLCVIDVDVAKVLINPEYRRLDRLDDVQEGCLSIPDYYTKVLRAQRIYVKAIMSLSGEPIEFWADGLLAHCIQHEYDHLEGRLFIDYLT